MSGDKLSNIDEFKSKLYRELSERQRVGFKRLNDGATIPTKAHPTDSGFDLYASEDVIIGPGDTTVVPTGIAVQLPVGYEAQVRSRSGITAKTKLRVQLGTIDQDYRGEIGVIVDNVAHFQHRQCSHTGGLVPREDNSALFIEGNRSVTLNLPTRLQPAYFIRKGDKLAQLVIQPLPAVEAYEIEGDLSDSDRGDKGFGSTGV